MNILCRRLIALAAALLICSVVSAQDANRRDGNWWRTESRSSQLDYMVGVFDGMQLGHNLSYWNLIGDKQAGDALSRVAKSYSELSQRYFRNVTVGQLVDGLDVFYSDFRNRTIRVHDAIWLVVNQIAGTPQEELEKMVENWRRSAAR